MKGNYTTQSRGSGTPSKWFEAGSYTGARGHSWGENADMSSVKAGDKP